MCNRLKNQWVTDSIPPPPAFSHLLPPFAYTPPPYTSVDVHTLVIMGGAVASLLGGS